MKLPNNGENGVLTNHILSSNQASNTRIGLHLIKLLLKWRGPMETPNNPGRCEDYRLLSRNWLQCPIAEDTTYTTVEHEEVKLVYIVFIPYMLMSFVQEGTLHTAKGEM